MPCVSLFDQKITDGDAKHCVSTVALVIQNGNRSRTREKILRPERAAEKNYYEYSLQIFIVTVHEFLNSEF
jgi:endo-1,4-beta-D-glucanase Y